jgi:hypothetical protein
MKMVGAFPESDEEEDEEEAEIGPLDVPRAVGRDKLVSTSPGGRQEEPGSPASVESPGRPTATDGGGCVGYGEEQGRDNEVAEWGVD